MFVDPDKGEVYVTNSVGQSILVFGAKDTGNVAPRRVLKGPKTGLSYPASLAIDLKNQELWVSNLGNASATVYPLTAINWRGVAMVEWKVDPRSGVP
jgi:DNA-binding beta-propeller fold protein YncE